MFESYHYYLQNAVAVCGNLLTENNNDSWADIMKVIC